MRWYRKAQIAWFGIFAVAFLVIAWTVLPITELTADGRPALVLDRVMYSAIGLILAGLLAAAAGGESDYQDALRRYGFASDESFDSNKAMIYWMRVGAIVFLLAPFVLLALEAEGHLTPLSSLRELLASLTSEDAVAIFSLLYNSIYGLCITLLAIDFFLTPLSAQVVRDETSFVSKERFGARATDICSRFLGALKMIAEQNVPELRGTPNVWTKLTVFVGEIEAAKHGVALLSMDLDETEALTAHLTELQDAMEELIEFPLFLSRYDPARPTAGKRHFRNAAGQNMTGALALLGDRLSAVYNDLNLPLPQNSRQLLDRLGKEVTTGWSRVCAAGEAHYQVRATPAPTLRSGPTDVAAAAK